MKITPPRTVRDVVEMTGRTRNWICAAANTGALESLPRTGLRHQFTDEMVADWIKRGTPEFPQRSARLRTA